MSELSLLLMFSDNFFFAFLISLMRAVRPAHLIILNLITLIISDEACS
jgi:hypothetical protein